MKPFAKYDIAIQGLSEKQHTFEFEGDDRFFAAFEQDIVESGRFKAVVTLDKSVTMLRLLFTIDASVTLVCDRSLETFEEPLHIEQMYVYKFGHEPQVISEDIEIILFGEPEINVAQLLFDYIALAVPMKKLHPRFRDEEEEEEFPPHPLAEEPDEATKDADGIDPRWAALKNLKK